MNINRITTTKIISLIIVIIIVWATATFKGCKQDNTSGKLIDNINNGLPTEEVIESSPTAETIESNPTEIVIENDKIEVTEEPIKENYIDVWVAVTNIYAKKEPNPSSEIIENYSWNTKLSVAYINEEWAKIKDLEYYIERIHISEKPARYTDCDVPSNNTIKSYMDYRLITLKSSRQYELQKSLAYTNEQGLRMVNGRYCIALGSYYTTTIGQYVDVELENGKIICGILADCKADKDTDSTNRIHSDGSVVEFVIDIEELNCTIRKLGDISHLNGWNSKVANIKVYDKIENF